MVLCNIDASGASIRCDVEVRERVNDGERSESHEADADTYTVVRGCDIMPLSGLARWDE